MKRDHSTTKVAGVDVSKRTLEMAVFGSEGTWQVANTPAGFAELIACLRQQRVGRVGLEASGGYERAVMAALAEAGFELVLHQPLEVRLFARLKRLRAKNDRLDAHLIAAATAHTEAVKAAADPLLQALAEQLAVYELLADQAAQLKCLREHLDVPGMQATIAGEIARLKQIKDQLLRQLYAEIKAREDLHHRYRLLRSLPGVGPVVAITLLVRMPELGAMKKGQPAALLGVAPYDRDSGALRGQRFIGGGRERPRRFVYIAALSAKRCDPDLRAFAERLLAKGKPAKKVIAAVMRKLIEAANLVLRRGSPWITSPAC